MSERQKLGSCNGVEKFVAIRENGRMANGTGPEKWGGYGERGKLPFRFLSFMWADRETKETFPANQLLWELARATQDERRRENAETKRGGGIFPSFSG